MNHVIALSPTDLAPAQASLIQWVDQRITHWIAERKDSHDAYEHAVAHKWKAEPFKRAMKKADKRIGFYRKIRSAIEAGYLIVPNFPLNIFAIRTKAENGRYAEANYRHSEALVQGPQHLPQGSGDYKNPNPFLITDEREDGNGGTRTVYSPGELSDELEIPMQLVKPEIMQAVDRAKALKLFDSIGVCQDRQADPIVCGQIEDGSGWNRKRVTFFIAWFVDLDSL